MNYKGRKMNQCEQLPVLRELLITQVKHASDDWRDDWILKTEYERLSQGHIGNNMAENTFFLVSE